jgi:hypothetical protein
MFFKRLFSKEFIIKGNEWHFENGVYSIKCDTNKCIFLPNDIKNTIDKWKFKIYLNDSEVSKNVNDFCFFERDKIKVYMKKDFDFIKITSTKIN